METIKMNYNEIYTVETLHYMVNEINSWDGSLENLAYYEMDQFNELMSGHDPEFIAHRIFFGNFNPTHDYFRFDGYGNIETISNWELERVMEDWADDIVIAYKELSNEGFLSGYLLDEIEDNN